MIRFCVYCKNDDPDCVFCDLAKSTTKIPALPAEEFEPTYAGAIHKSLLPPLEAK